MAEQNFFFSVCSKMAMNSPKEGMNEAAAPKACVCSVGVAGREQSRIKRLPDDSYLTMVVFFLFTLADAINLKRYMRIA